MKRIDELEARADEATAENQRGMEAWRAAVIEFEGSDDEILDHLFELAAKMGKVRDGLRELRADIAQEAQRLAETEERKRQRQEAANLNTYFSDEMVREALARTLRAQGVKAARAGAVARELSAFPTQSDRIRTGLALRRLSKDGKVKRLPPRDDHDTCRWGLGRA